MFFVQTEVPKFIFRNHLTETKHMWL